jgi:biopolymer transport protein ExbD
MAEIIQNEGGGKKKGKRRAKKHSTHIDMTPMVDLFCLLLTFFMLTTAFSKPKMMEIALPEPPKIGDPEPPQIPKERALTIILDANDKVFYYFGNANPLKPPLPAVNETDFSKDGIRKVLLNRNLDLYRQISTYNNDVLTGKIKAPRDSVEAYIKHLKRTDRTSPIVLVKALDGATYGDMVNIVDELTITEVPVYSIVGINLLDRQMVENYKKSVAQLQ